MRLALATLFSTLTLIPQNSEPVRMVESHEPGTPLTLTVAVVDSQSGDPVPDASVYIYQTDAKGLYSPDGSSAQEKPPRIAARLKTDAEGRFTVRTIRPGGYPGGRITEHIHYEIEADDYNRLVGEILFADDPRLDESSRAGARRRGWPIVQPEKAAGGALTATVELPLDPS